MSDLTQTENVDVNDYSFADIEEVLASRLIPEGVYGFRVGTIEVEDYENKDGEEKQRVVIPAEIVAVTHVGDLGEFSDAEELIGVAYSQRFTTTTIGLGQSAFLMRRMGVDVSGAQTLAEAVQILNSVDDKGFYGRIKHRKVKINKEDRVFAEFDFSAKEEYVPVFDSAE